MAQVLEFGFLTLEEIKYVVALDRLKKFDNNITQTAKSLNITRPTLHKIMADYEKVTEDQKKRIEANRLVESGILSQERGAFENDPATGMSVPKAPAPLPKIDLVMPVEPKEDGLVRTLSEANNRPKDPNLFRPVVKPSPVIKPEDPMAAESKRERERFAKLDKTPYSKKHKMEDRANRELAEIANAGKTTKAKKGKKKEKAKAR